jgi:2-oxoglutarate dehydrogenase E2 component (dihydrolipoamide succinyltransferase)
MNVAVKIPKHGLSMTKGTVGEVLVKAGDVVKPGDILFHVETDKSVLEVESETAGTVAEILAETGDELAVGATVLTIEDGRENPQTAAAAAPPQPDRGPGQVSADGNAKIKATPAARKLAQEKGIDLSTIATVNDVIDVNDVINSL